MFLIGTAGGSLLMWAFGREWWDWKGRGENGPFLTQAASSLTDGVLIWIGALLGLGAAIAAAEGQGLVALGLLVAFGFIYNVMILNMLRGRRAVTNAIKVQGDQLKRQRARMEAMKKDA